MPRVIRPIDVESAVRRRRSKLRLAACVLALTSGCGSEKARLGSMKVVDPTVQKQPRLTHEDIPGGYRLGPYDILAPKVREFAIDQTMPIDGVAAYPAYRYDLELTLFVPAKQRTHDVQCVGRRQANLDNTFAAVATEQKDNVLIECDIRSARSRWAFVAGGRLDDNIGGDLVQEGARTDAAPVKVEIILWSTRAKYFNRDLAYPVLQVRRGKQVIAAMIVGDREWAWVQPDAPAELREVAMATLAAVRHLPLGFEQ
jgi:hypothetical protein